ncbi:MAG TPA: imidazole glycerol phosphate synthase subunit HisH [Gemmataceae bacterium]|nr:imidazole glycerol phosphate synthase subunit HisH [Gemmataceae bacterium]
MIAVVDCGMGNLHSVRLAFDRLGAEVAVVQRPEQLRQAERIVFPGVGAFGECVRRLRESGIAEALEEEVRRKGTPYLGICLGMQVLAESGEENGVHEGLGWISGVVRRLRSDAPNLRVPHVGWNDVHWRTDSPLFAGLRKETAFYFVHGYHLAPRDADVAAATCEHGETFTAAIQRDNILAVQFHPEKSQRNGLRLLSNFLAWKP